MENQIILKKREGPALTLILNRPEVHNAFNFELAKALAMALKEASKNKEIRVVVLRGAGKAFSAGGDLKVFQQNLKTSDQAFRKVSTYLNQAILQIRNMPQPVIAAVTGPAYAAAFGLALACDFVVATHGSTLSPSFINIALSPNASTTYFLPRLIGTRRATEALMRGKVFTASEALQLGMINHVWAEEIFEEELKRLVNDLANRPAQTLARIKKLMHSSLTNSLSKQLELEKNQIALSSLSEDFKAGVTAFIEKRRP